MPEPVGPRALSESNLTSWDLTIDLVSAPFRQGGRLQLEKFRMKFGKFKSLVHTFQIQWPLAWDL